MAGGGAMRRERFGHVLLIALCLSAPAFAYTASGVDDPSNPSIDNPGLDVTRHAVPPPDVTAKPAETPTVAANPLWAIPLSAVAASAGAGRSERTGRGAAATASASAGAAAASELDPGRHGCRRERERGRVHRHDDARYGAAAHRRGP